LRHRNANAGDFLARVTSFVESDGARDFNLISRELKIPYQTLRNRMIHLKDQGLGILAIPDFDKLGLERVRVFFTLPPSTKDIRALMGGLHQSAGLKLYSRSIDSQVFDCEFAIPEGTLSELEELVRKLEELKTIQDASLNKIVWKDLPTLKTQFYDFPKGEWDVDFSTLAGDPSSVHIPDKKSSERIDYPDLMMVKELEQDPWVKNVDLCKKAGLSVGDAAYHLNKHVFGKNLIKSFRLRWDGTKEAWLKHSIIFKTYLFEEISSEEARHAMSVLTSVPFIWSHMMMEDGTYMAETILPLSHYAETTQYISSELRAVGLRPSVTFEKDWTCLSTFTIPYLLYNREASTWNFSADHALEYTLQMIKTYSS
jgi:DNA-binding Lrp family transcriptional regulator